MKRHIDLEIPLIIELGFVVQDIFQLIAKILNFDSTWNCRYYRWCAVLIQKMRDWFGPGGKRGWLGM